MILGSPRAHFRRIDSTNERARVLASSGAPHGTLVTADEQTAGRGRQGRSWVAPAGTALLCSLVLRDPPRLLPLIAGVAVAQSVGPDARVKWPNDVLLRGRKVAGILVEGRPQERWAVLGIGLNVALRSEDLPPDVRSRAGGLGLSRTDIEPVRSRLLEELEYWLGSSPQAVLAELSRRDALLERPVRWAGGTGRGAGVDGEGRLRVRTRDGLVSLDAGEVHLEGELPGA